MKSPNLIRLLPGRKSPQKAHTPLRTKRLSFEPLEERQLLAVDSTMQVFGTYTGGRLDNYTNGSISFDIEITATKIVENTPAQLTLRVYDVDADGEGGKFYPPEVDYVYVNGNYVGTLTGANDSWSICTFEVDPSYLVCGKNSIYIDIAVAGNGPDTDWKVNCDWGELRVEVEEGGIEHIEVSSDSGRNVPVTTEKVKLEAFLDGELLHKINEGELFIREAVWEINGEKGIENKATLYNPTLSSSSTLIYNEFKPEAGNHGNKTVTCTIALEDTNGNLFEVKHEGNFKLFFRHDECDGMPDQGNEPNWYYWWKHDGAVPELNDPGVSYDPTLKAKGKYTNTIKIGPSAVKDIPTLTTTIKPEQVIFQGKDKGIDAVRSTVIHEMAHRETLGTILDWDWDYNVDMQERKGLKEKNGYALGTSEEKEYLENNLFWTDWFRKGDGLGVSVENEYGTWAVISDTWDMASVLRIFGVTVHDGDKEFIGFKAGSEAPLGIKENDWSSEGKQAAEVTQIQILSLMLGSSTEIVDQSSTIPEIKANSYGVIQKNAENTNTITTLDSGVMLTDNYSSRTVDLEGDAKFDELIVAAEMVIPTDGVYNIATEIFDVEENSVGYIFEEYTLTAGIQTIEFHFDGRVIGTQAIDGVFEFDIRIYDDNMNIVDGGIAVYTTQSYQVSEFEQILDVTIVGEQAIDFDANTLYDTLQITANVVAPAEGDYNFHAELYSADGTFIAYSLVDATMIEGENLIDFHFKGTDIAKTALNGPYRVLVNSSLITETNVFFNDNIHQTAAYQYTQFEGAQAALNGTYSDHGTDTDGDGKFDFLTVEVGVDVAIAGTYEISAYLYDSTGTYTDYVLATAELQPGQQTVALDFESIFILAHGQSGTFTLSSILLSDVNGTHLTYMIDAYTTQSYNLDDFQQEAVVFSKNNTETAVDDDKDAKIDRLDVSLGVNVNTAGTYHFSAVVKDAQGNIVEYVNKIYELASGSQQIIVGIDGRSLFNLQADGPYFISAITLFDSQGHFVATSNSYTTQEYQYGDFESPSVYLGENIGDSLVAAQNVEQPKNLSISMEVFVENAGRYNVNARLVDVDGNEIGWATINPSLVAGEFNTIELVFSGEDIYSHGVAGPYFLKDLSIYAISGSSGDSLFLLDVYETEAYSLSDFASRTTSLIAIGSDAGPLSQPIVQVYDARTEEMLFEITADQTFGENYTGGVQVATGDLNGDGVPDIAVVPGRNMAPHVFVFDGKDGSLMEDYCIPASATYGQSFKDGLTVAIGDVLGNGMNDLILAPIGGQAVVMVFENVTDTDAGTTGFNPQVARQFNAFEDNKQFIGGASLAVGNTESTTSEAKEQIVVGSGAGIEPIIRFFGVEETQAAYQPARQVKSVRTDAVGGVNVGIGDVNGDGYDELVVAAKNGGRSWIDIYDLSPQAVNLADPIHSFQAFGPTEGNNAAVDIAILDINDDGFAEIIAFQSAKGKSGVKFRSFDMNDADANSELAELELLSGLAVKLQIRS